MADKKKSRKEKGNKELQKETLREAWWDTLRGETRHSILSITFLVFGIFFVLASLGKAGVLGNTLYKSFIFLFGAGYFLVPTVLFLACISLIISVRPNIVKNALIGGGMFLLSALAIANIVISDQAGGRIGYFIAWPFLRYLDFWVSVIVFGALFIVSLLVMLNGAIVLNPFRKEEEDDEETKDSLVKSAIAQATESIQGAISAVSSPNTKTEARNDSHDFALRPTKTNIKRVFTPPPLDLLETDKGKPSSGDIKANSNIIKRTLQNFGIEVEMAEISIGPSITQYTLKPAEGIKISRILGLQNDLSLALAAHPLRIEAPIPGRPLVGIEVPNSSKTIIGLGTLLASEHYQKAPEPLLVALGKDVTGLMVFSDVAKMPHSLIAGATGAGKSVTIHAIITSLLYRNSPESLRFIMIDPKRVELSVYNKIPHMLSPVITSAKQAILTLKWAGGEMDRRYDLLLKAGARDIKTYHEEQGGFESMPYLMIIIDELADLMTSYPREMETVIVRLAQMSRAVGIHLVLSTQRPSVEIITGLIKANITTRIALQVASQIDSRTILDMAGAEKLLGKGDMLYQGSDTAKPRRLQAPYISEKEVKKVVEFLEKEYRDTDFEDVSSPEAIIGIEGQKNMAFSSKSSNGWQPVLDLDAMEEKSNTNGDELYEAVREEVIKSSKASTSFLQRKFSVGYARAARLMDMLEERGVVSQGQGAKQREVLIKDNDPLERHLSEKNQNEVIF